MIIFEPTPVLAVATAVWVVWRLMLWRQTGGNAVREVAIAVLFVWSLVVVYFTFFPMTIIFYDWHTRFSLVPFASISQLIRDTPPAVAFENIVGNLLLFVPIGVLLPVLFMRLRSLVPLLWRSAAISLAIETTQMLTGARAVDIDDVILNTTGAALGFAVFSAATALLNRTPRSRGFFDRIGIATDREPLSHARIPAGLTALITVPVMIATVVSGTMSDGSNGIVGDAMAGWPESSLVARADVAEHAFLVILHGRSDTERLRLAVYKRVLPGRFTPLHTDEMDTGRTSRYSWTITPFNTTTDEKPVLMYWGSNPAGATTLVVTGDGLVQQLPLTAGYFAAGFPFDPHSPFFGGDVMEEPRLQFLDGAGDDVTGEFLQASG